MSTDRILTARDGAVATVTVNRPAVLNALDAQTVRTLTSVLTDLGQDDEIRCVVLTGAGDRAFVAGAIKIGLPGCRIHRLTQRGLLFLAEFADVGAGSLDLLQRGGDTSGLVGDQFRNNLFEGIGDHRLIFGR